LPTDAVIYYRTNATRKALTAYDTLDKLIAAAPSQVLVFDEFNSLADCQEDPQINVSDDPHYDPTSDPIVEKQYNGNFGRKLDLTIKSDTDQSVWRQKLTSFLNLIPLEPAYHENGIFGFFHPKIADFNVDPTNEFGYTINRAPKSYTSGHEALTILASMTLGGNQKLAGP
jgi:hypothetical protein